MSTAKGHTTTERSIPSGHPADALSDAATDFTAPGQNNALAVLDDTPETQNIDEPHGLAAIEAELVAETKSEPTTEEDLTTSEVCHIELPAKLMRIVDARINIWRRLNQIEQCRQQIPGQTDDRGIRDEANRQSREIKKVPSRDTLDASIANLRDTLIALPATAKPATSDGNCKSSPPTTNQLLIELLSLGIEQADLLTKRAKLDAAVVAAALPATDSEPILKLCRSQGLNGDDLMGWTYYAMGILQRIGHYRAIEDDHHRQLAQARDQRKNKGLMAALSIGRNQEVSPLNPAVREILHAARQELQAIEPQLTELYWTLYEDLAWLLCRPADHAGRDRPSPEDLVTIRAFLRYGMISSHPGMIGQELADFIHQDCDDDVHTWANQPETTHVVYADEYIEGIANKKLTVSPDENLELNGRNSPVWKADRVWRQAVINRTRQELAELREQELQTGYDQLQPLIQQKEKQYEILRADGKKAEADAVSRELITVKSQASRLAKAAGQIDRIFLSKVRNQALESADKLVIEERVLSMENVVRREARFIRRAARLAARLKEHFPPFILRDSFDPHRSNHHSRKAVLDEIARLEQADPSIFHSVLLPNHKLDRRVTVRMSPIFLLPPCRGQMAFSFCERRWDDNGRLVLPLIALRQDSLTDMLVNMFADFRWDCSREEAGMDWIAADALCAAYAAVRWSVRKLPEKTRKIMGIDPKLKDKPNWRIHYRLFVLSTKDAGRLLFTKCDEIYKIVVQYIGLPPGTEPLRRD